MRKIRVRLAFVIPGLSLSLEAIVRDVTEIAAKVAEIQLANFLTFLLFSHADIPYFRGNFMKQKPNDKT